MIHGKQKNKKVKTEQELRDQEELSNKINSKLADFFSISRKQVTPEQLPKYLEFTAILMQLTSDIPSIFNFRRELIQAAIEAKKAEKDEKEQEKLYSADIKLTSKLLQDDPKSYTIWSYRQWLVQSLFSLNPAIISSEKQLCKMMLTKDEKNFHVWNYRNWLNSILLNLNEELAFTSEKIKSNPFNFSPYHFRSKFLVKQSQAILLEQDPEIKGEIFVYGMPENIFRIEIENVHTAMFLNPSEEAPWLYYSWLVKQIVPAFVVKKTRTGSTSTILFNMKVSGFRSCLKGPQPLILKWSCGKLHSDRWDVEGDGDFVITAGMKSVQDIKLELSGRAFLGEEVTADLVKDIKEFYGKEQCFLKQILEAEEGKCRFALLQLLELQKLTLLCGLSAEEWDSLLVRSKDYLAKLLAAQESKGQQYILKQRDYWQGLLEGKASEAEQVLKRMF